MRGRARVPASLLLAASFLACLVPPAAGVEPLPGRPLPDESPATVLPLPVMEALAFDLDGDGVRELLTVGVAADAPGLAAVQVWWVDADGSAEPSNQVHVRRSASVDERTSGQRGLLGIDRDYMIAVKIDEPAKLMVVERDGREVPLVAAIGVNPDFDRPCCLTIWEIMLEAPGVAALRLVADTARSAVELIAADVDADQTDELLVSEGPIFDFTGGLEISFLRWTGSQFDATRFPIANLAACCATLQEAGETDGFPGEEVLLTGAALEEDLPPQALYRLTVKDDQLSVAPADVDPISDAVSGARLVSLEGGPRIIVSAEFFSLFLWWWPPDLPPQRLAGRTTGGTPAAVFGSGSDARVFVASGFGPGSVQVLPGDLGFGAGPSVIIGRDLRQGKFTESLVGDEAIDLVPFFGVVPGGLPGAPDAYVFAGRLVRPVPDPEVLAEADDIALLPGLEPVGRMGPAGAWIGLLDGFNGFESAALATSLQGVHAPAQLRLVATASVMEPEVNDGNLEPTFFGVARDPERPAALLVGDGAVDAEIAGPSGTTVWWSTRGGLDETSIDPDGVARIRLLDEAGPNAPDGSGATVNIWLVTPAGHGYAGTWRIRVYRQPPTLDLMATDALLNFSPTLRGQTVPGATVRVDGVEVEVAADGSFETPVSVGILPTDLRVVAIDPIGNRTERVVSVVWPLDYRRLPFVPFAVLLTVAAALVLFLRRPDSGPRRRTPDDGATFEEIGG